MRSRSHCRSTYDAVVRGILGFVAVGAGGYALLVRGALTLDLDVGRRVRPLGPIERTIAAPPETVFDVIASPYLDRTPRAMQERLNVWERGSDMALVAHVTTRGRLTTTHGRDRALRASASRLVQAAARTSAAEAERRAARR